MANKTTKEPAAPSRWSKLLKNKWVVLPIYFLIVVVLSSIAWMRILNPLYPWQRPATTPSNTLPAVADTTPTIPPVQPHPDLPDLAQTTGPTPDKPQSAPAGSQSTADPTVTPSSTDPSTLADPGHPALALEDPSAPPMTTGVGLTLLTPEDEELIEEVLPTAVVYQAPDPANTEMIWPVDPTNIIVQHGRHLSKTMEDWRHHNGIDIEAAAGTAVKATLNGKVVRIYNDAQLGETLILEHANGLKTKYANLASANLIIGTTVKRGDTIGKVGKTARYEMADAPHLHFEILRDDQTTDPLNIIKP